MVELNQIMELEKGFFSILVQIDLNQDEGNFKQVAYAIKNRKAAGMPPLVFDISANGDKVRAFKIFDLKVETLFTFVNSIVAEKVKGNEYHGMISDIDLCLKRI